MLAAWLARKGILMSSVVRDFYNANVEMEWARLTQPLCAIEFASTLRLIDRYFPPSGYVGDIGSGPGRYALELCKRGYAVTLVDLAEKELAFAREQFERAHLQAEDFISADARDLVGVGANVFDAALLLGPLIHITEKPERAKALAELRRVLKPGGVAIVSYLNSWGLIRTGVTDFPHRYRDANFLRAMLGEIAFPEPLSGFTISYWSTPPTARQELFAAGFDVVSYACAEGVVGGMWPLIEKLATTDPVAYANLLEFAAETCELPQFRDGGDHLHFVILK
jgi:S-adenosylmethionine-dependent methyltransferase